MNIKNKTLLWLAAASMALTACSDWTDTEIKDPTNLTVTNKSEEYYAKLREYKNSDHEKSFGWFGNWTGEAAMLNNSLKGLPDSVDFVSLWGNWSNLNDKQKKDLEFVQKVKGTKVLMCFIVMDIGDQLTPPIPADKAAAGTTWKQWRKEFWGWGDTNASRIAAAEKYANAICDSIDKYGYDGFDIDAEPNFAQPFATDKELWTEQGVMPAYVKALSKRIGPKSGTNKMLVVDGEPNALPDSLGNHFDYFILQAYTTTSDYELNDRLAVQINHFQNKMSAEEVAKKIIVCENFENYAAKGGVNFTTKLSTTIPSLLGMAYWQPTYDGKTYKKGGVGSYHMEYEYGQSSAQTTYPWLRKAIQIMNHNKKGGCNGFCCPRTYCL